MVGEEIQDHILTSSPVCLNKIVDCYFFATNPDKDGVCGTRLNKLILQNTTFVKPVPKELSSRQNRQIPPLVQRAGNC